MEELPTLLDEESDGSPTKMASTSTNQLPLRKRGRLQVFKQEGGQLMFSRQKSRSSPQRHAADFHIMGNVVSSTCRFVEWHFVKLLNETSLLRPPQKETF